MIDVSAEELANKVLEEVKKEKGKLEFPIDPFELLKREGILISLMNTETLSGIIINDLKNVTIVGINRNDPLSRQRFTAAHEYCHFIKDLKKGKDSEDTIQCLKNSKSDIELYANKFAACLLMPIEELKKICNVYKNEKGFLDFESITIISEYFGVSFKSCIYEVAYNLKMIDGDISKEALEKRIIAYKPTQKRKKLIKDSVDSRLLSNMINALSYIMIDLNHYTGNKFIQNYIFYDNKLEGVEIEREKLNFILADLNFNGINSKYYNPTSPNICMTLGNLELQKFVITTNEKVSILACQKLHCLLYNFVPYKDGNGVFRVSDAMLTGGTIQPIPYFEIPGAIDNLDKELKFFINNIQNYSNSEYIEQVAYFIYRFVVIHPFSDGNGRISRALLNWMLRMKNIPPIYIDDWCRDEYYSSLSEIDKNENYVPLIMLIEKRIINTIMELHNYLYDD